MREDPHTVTVEKVLEVFMKELWSIIKKDITRKMVEGVAFKAFDKWWDEQEQKSKVGFTSLRRRDMHVIVLKRQTYCKHPCMFSINLLNSNAN